MCPRGGTPRNFPDRGLAREVSLAPWAPQTSPAGDWGGSERSLRCESLPGGGRGGVGEARVVLTGTTSSCWSRRWDCSSWVVGSCGRRTKPYDSPTLQQTKAGKKINTAKELVIIYLNTRERRHTLRRSSIVHFMYIIVRHGVTNIIDSICAFSEPKNINKH